MPVSARQIEWTVSRTDSIGKTTSTSLSVIRVSRDLTQIIDRRETIVIDYPNSRLFRTDRASDSCRVYPFGMPHASLPSASLAVESDDEIADLRHVSFGMLAALSQSAAAPVPSRYGEVFPSCRAEMRVAGELPLAADLAAIAAHRADIFHDYPLLRRIDPTGLIEPLGGFPVSGTCLSPIGSSSMRMVSPPEVTGIPIDLPRNCLSSY